MESQTLKSNTEEIKSAVHKFYSKLYKSDGVDENCQQEFLNRLVRKKKTE